MQPANNSRLFSSSWWWWVVEDNEAQAVVEVVVIGFKYNTNCVCTGPLNSISISPTPSGTSNSYSNRFSNYSWWWWIRCLDQSLMVQQELRIKFSFFNNNICRWWRWRLDQVLIQEDLVDQVVEQEMEVWNNNGGGSGNTPPVTPPQGNNGGNWNASPDNSQVVVVVEQVQQEVRFYSSPQGGPGGAGSGFNFNKQVQWSTFQVQEQDILQEVVEGGNDSRWFNFWCRWSWWWWWRKRGWRWCWWRNWEQLTQAVVVGGGEITILMQVVLVVQV